MLLTINDLNQPPEVLDQYIIKAQQLSQVYFDYIAKSQNTNSKYEVELFGSSRRAKGIHASEASKCMRALTYGIMGKERVVDIEHADVNMQMRFRLGTAIHAMIQSEWHEIAKASNGLIYFKSEVPINPGIEGAAEEWNIHSRCDGIITLYNDNPTLPSMRVGIEIKSASADEYEKLKVPKPEHIEQSTIYMKTLNLPLMWIIYYNKSNSNITTSFPPYLFAFDDNLWSNVLEMRFAKLTHLADNSQLGEKDEGFHCKWCPFSYDCKPDYLNRKKPTMAINQGMRRI